MNIYIGLLLIGIIIGIVIGCIVCYYVILKKMKHRLDISEKISDKHLAILNLFSIWIQNISNGLKIEDYLAEKGILNIAIYGMSFVGERLYDELEEGKVKVRYCIDRNANNLYKDIDIVSPDENLPDDIDAIIVTAFFYFDEIRETLSTKINVPIISIDDIVYSL